MNTHESSTETNRTITLRVPKIRFSPLSSVIILLIVVSVLQTIQLWNLSQSVAQAKVGSGSTTTGVQSSASGVALPEMVGGC